MEKINFQDYPSTDTPVNSTNLNDLQDNVEADIGDLTNLTTTVKTNVVNAINEVNDKIKTADFTGSITPSTSRGTAGYGESTVDISSINANKILGITFYSSSTHMLWGVGSDINTNVQSLSIYGFRITGTYNSSISVKIRILYQ